MNTLIAWIRIIRPPIIFISCLGALVGVFNSAIFLNMDLSNFQIFMVVLGAFFLASGLMIHNDVTDLESDKVNRPYKPLSTGAIKLKTANFIGILMMILSIFTTLLVNIRDSGSINWNCGILTFLIVVLGIYYNKYGKSRGIFGHIAVALGVGAIPYWGSIAVFPTKLLLMLPLTSAIFIQEIGREIMVATGDFKGDSKAGFKTLPVQIGRKRAMQITLIFYLAFIPIFPLPAFDWLGIGVPQVFGSLYLIGGTLFAITLLLTWVLTYKVVLQDDEKSIWKAFEKYGRTGTRTMVIIFQIFLLLEIFY
ncbi:4-hydroxybenzoate polyprenyltransferase [Thermoplasmatales archaeon SG8-52-4]|nr:MAG: 4-hydroxybenzoate polyprenyltransferase [Thermoplasmatales archaeon SG8-52-4]